MAHENQSSATANGRRTAIIVIVVAFLASATTAMLAFVFSHRAQQADAAALAADTTDLHDMADDWDKHVALAEQAAPDARGPYVDMLTSRTDALVVWKPRTPCGGRARDDLRKIVKARLTRMLASKEGQARASDGERTDVRAALDASLQRCAAEPVSSTPVKAA